MNSPQWPACVANLTPLRLAFSADPPADIVAGFRAAGWPESAPLPVRMVALLGQCSTAAYRECPTLPAWHIERDEYDGDLDEIGRYYWCDFDLTDGAGRRVGLRMAFNEGDADCNDGVWGLVWDRDAGGVVAELTSDGDSEGLVSVVSAADREAFAPPPWPIPDRESLNKFRSPTVLRYAHDDPFEQLIGVAIGWCSGHR